MRLAWGVWALLFAATLGVGGCGRFGFERIDPRDSGADAGMDASIDAGLDAGTDAGSDANIDATMDSAIDADVDADDLDAGGEPDTGVDAGPIAPNFPPITVTNVSTVGLHTCVTRSGALYCWGDNAFGQLGINNHDAQNAPVAVVLPTAAPITQVSAGDSHTCAIEQGTGAVYCWGDNRWGQLGQGDRTPRSQPSRVDGLPRAVQVSAGYGFTCAIAENNDLWCWGNNDEGQFGIGDEGSPVVISERPRRSGSDNDWTQISTGQGRACGIRHPGTVWCSGRNSTLGLGLGPNAPTQVRIWTQVGTEVDWTRVTVSQDGACGLRNNSSAYCWGTFLSGLPFVQDTPSMIDAGGNPVIHGTAGVFTACAVQNNRTLWCWGRNEEGQLGTGGTSAHVPVTVLGFEFDWHSVALGRFHTCAQKVNGNVFCTGLNNSGQLGLGDNAQRTTMTRVTLP